MVGEGTRVARPASCRGAEGGPPPAPYPPQSVHSGRTATAGGGWAAGRPVRFHFCLNLLLYVCVYLSRLFPGTFRRLLPSSHPPRVNLSVSVDKRHRRRCHHQPQHGRRQETRRLRGAKGGGVGSARLPLTRQGSSPPFPRGGRDLPPPPRPRRAPSPQQRSFAALPSPPPPLPVLPQPPPRLTPGSGAVPTVQPRRRGGGKGEKSGSGGGRRRSAVA